MRNRREFCLASNTIPIQFEQIIAIEPIIAEIGIIAEALRNASEYRIRRKYGTRNTKETNKGNPMISPVSDAH